MQGDLFGDAPIIFGAVISEILKFFKKGSFGTPPHPSEF